MLRIAYAAFRFLFEILCIFVAGYGGFHLFKAGWPRYVAGILVPLAILLVWSVWGAPASPNRLPPIPKLFLELAIYSASGALLYNAGNKAAAVAFTVIGAINAVANCFWQ